MCASSLTYGKLYCMLPMKNVFIVSLGIFMVGSVLCAVASTSAAFIVGRAIAGLGGAGIVNGANIMISHVAPLRYRPMLLGLAGGVECMAIAVGPIIAGAITTYSTWRVCFYINIPVSVIAIVVAVTCVSHAELAREPTEATQFGDIFEFFQKIDVPGIMILIPMVVCLLLGLQWGGSTYAWKSAPVIVTLVAAAVLLGIFGIQQQRKGPLATVQPGMLRYRSVTLGACMSFCNAAALYIVGYYLLLWYQTVLSFSVFKSGIYDLAYDLGFVLSILSAGFITSWIGYYTPTMVAGSTLMSIGAGLLTTLNPGSNMVAVIFYQIIFSVGNGLAYQQPYVAVQTVLKKELIPSALTMLSFAQSLGGTISLAAAQAAYLSSLDTHEGNQIGISADGMALIYGSGKATLDIMNQAIVAPFYIATAFSAFTMISALGVNWNSVKENKKDAK
ncbi:unnamed protein product [Penicillium salamii]|uniref:Major facilitator superfamily (MFS) profile domain-containing protein n=1 Tax=Penicillium salamii TaxID=1612424 RepID=A0A9W4I4N9_9EURO|nr:unnamed protein product [Penicillium salamii]